MAETSSTHLSPETFVAQFKQHGVTHVVWLPDSETNFLYTLMKAEPSLTLVAVARILHRQLVQVELVLHGDELGVVAFDESAHWVVDTQPLGSIGDLEGDRLVIVQKRDPHRLSMPIQHFC